MKISMCGFGLQETWAAMESIVDKGLVRSIGVSNYSIHKLQKLHGHTRIPVSVNQVICVDAVHSLSSCKSVLFHEML